MTCIWLYIAVAPKYQSKTFGTSMYKRVENYAANYGATEMIAQNVQPESEGWVIGIGYTRIGDTVDWTKTITAKPYSIPSGITEAPVRIVSDEYDSVFQPGDNHLFAWYDTDTGEAVAKVRIKFNG